MFNLKQSTAVTWPFFAHDVNGDGVTGLVDGGFTKRISKAGGAFAAMTVTITEMENGWYSLPLSTAHTDTLAALSISISHASCKRVNMQFSVSARVHDDLATPTNITSASGVTLAAVTHTGAVIPTVTAVTGLTAANLDATVSSRMATYTQPTGFLAATFPGTVASTTNITAGTLTTVTNLTNLPTIPANWLTAAGIAAGALNGKGDWNIGKTDYALSTTGINDVADQVWDELLTPGQHNNNNSAGRRLRLLAGSSDAFSGTAAGTPTSTTVEFDASASAVNEYYVPGLLTVEGAGGIQFRRIASYNGATKTATVATAFATTPSNGDAISVTAWASVRVSDIDANVITASALATDAVTEIQSGLATAGDLTAVKAKTDSLVFTVAGQVDSNIQYVNDIQVVGNGQPGTPWGP